MRKSNVKYSEDGKTLVRVPTDYEGELIVPQGVTEIGENAFYKCKEITHIVLPQGLTKIAAGAFNDCNFTEIEIPGTVEIIYTCTFTSCQSLTKVVLQDGIEHIQSEAFSHCAIKEITIPKSVRYIGKNLFLCTPIERITVDEDNETYDSRENCNAIIETRSNTLIISSKNSFIPDTVVTIGKYAFHANELIEKIYIPESVISIGERAFTCCTNLRVIEVDKDNPVYDSRENCNAIIRTATNQLVAGCGKTFIPDTVNSICEYAFEFCQSIGEIYIPDSVKEICEHAFSCCRKLKTVRLPQNLKLLDYGVFRECISLKDIEIPESVKYIKNAAFLYNRLNSLVIPKNVKEIGINSFVGEVKSIKVHSENAYFDSRGNCNAIIETASDTLIRASQTTVIPSSVKHIANYAFNYAKGLTEITIPEGVISIGHWAFYGYENLVRVTFPSTIEYIGDYAFDECKIKEIIVPLGEKKRFSKMEGLRECKKLIVEKAE